VQHNTAAPGIFAEEAAEDPLSKSFLQRELCEKEDQIGQLQKQLAECKPEPGQHAPDSSDAKADLEARLKRSLEREKSL